MDAPPRPLPDRRRRGTARFALRLLWRPVLVLLVAGGLAAWILGWQFPRHKVAPPAIDPAPVAAAETRRWTPRADAQPTPGCKPRAERRCIQGDAWWIDGCGTPYEKADECEHRRCDAGSCEPPDPADCGGVPPLGRCSNDVATTCDSGRPAEVDCGAQGRRCVMTEDGPACRERSDDDCEWPPGTTRCEGHELLACIEGVVVRIDCRIHGGTCEQRSGGVDDRCVVRDPVRGSECGACGCDPERTDEVCDGRDNDIDGWVDEDGGCEPVDVVAFVVEDERGNSSWADADIEEEIDVLNAAFAREDDLGLEFRLAEIAALREPDWLVLDQSELDKVVHSGRLYPTREAFFVPLLFTDDILVDDVPRPGIATVPNGVCGGVRRTRSPQSPIGLVALAKRHWPTTLSHEVGHFLGLCHTHSDMPDAPEHVVAVEGAEDTTCEPACEADADGICDTLSDAGPTVCAVDSECAIDCGGAPLPDPTNIMAYYPTCRSIFSPEQARVMRTSLWLRQKWHPCNFGDGCVCDPRRHDCPEGMTCRNDPGEDGTVAWACGLAGASVPAGPCKSTLDCKNDSICVIPPDGDDGRCVRPCDETTPDCDCRDVETFALPLCIDDALGPAP